MFTGFQSFSQALSLHKLLLPESALANCFTFSNSAHAKQHSTTKPQSQLKQVLGGLDLELTNLVDLQMKFRRAALAVVVGYLCRQVGRRVAKRSGTLQKTIVCIILAFVAEVGKKPQHSSSRSVLHLFPLWPARRSQQPHSLRRCLVTVVE